MNKEQYVTYQIAKLLKEKGFNWRVFNFYDEHGIFSDHIGSVYSLYNWNYPTKDEYGSQYCSAPTQQMACRWLREEYYIDILPLVRHVNKFAGELPIKEYSYRIYDGGGNVRISSRDWSRSYEKSIEAALEYTLKNLI